MLALSYLKEQAQYIKNRLKENSFENLLWFIDIGPKMFGISVKRKKMSVWFWVVHLTLLVYVYFVGTFVSMWKNTESAQDCVKSVFNVAILSLIANATWWTLKKRSLLQYALKKIDECDRLSRHSSFFQQRHEKYIKVVKLAMFLFYGLNLMDGFLIYLPYRVSLSNNFSMTQCFGMEPLTKSPNGEICVGLMALHEFPVILIVFNYQSLQLILVEHATIMYRLLALEMNKLSENDDVEVSKEILPSLINRHALLLDVINMLKLLYSVTIGINFGSNALSILLFFYLPLHEWLKFMPVLVYSIFVFFLYCFFCQRLIDSSELFERAVYFCGWENFELREKKLVLVMLRQSQKPVMLKAAGIVPVNIATFASSLQFIYRFVTVVKI